MADAVIFDVDGTLVDTNYLHAVCWWEACRQYGRHVNMTDVHHAIGMGSDKLLDHLLPDDRDADDDIRATHRALYGEYWTRLQAFEGAADLLRACASRGKTVVLASSASADELTALRATLDADDAITAATSSSEAGESKPAPDLVSIALDRADVPPDRAVFVGDTVWDVHACRKAGVPCVGVLTGGLSEAELRDAGAVAVYPSTAELLSGLDESPLI
jgi:HAD superfamily hydrolase (TIGR01509 family)